MCFSVTTSLQTLLQSQTANWILCIREWERREHAPVCYQWCLYNPKPFSVKLKNRTRHLEWNLAINSMVGYTISQQTSHLLLVQSYIDNRCCDGSALETFEINKPSQMDCLPVLWPVLLKESNCLSAHCFSWIYCEQLYVQPLVPQNGWNHLRSKPLIKTAE